MTSSKSGNVLGATMVITLAFSMVLAGMLSSVRTETRVSRQNALQLRAGYAAEATAQFALSQIRSTLQTKSSSSPTQFTSTGTPPVMPNASILGTTPSAALDDFGSSGTVSNVIGSLTTALGTSSSTSSPNAGRYTVAATNLTVGTFNAERLQFIDPANPLYAGDPLRGQTVRVREIRLLSSAQATDAVLGEAATAYCETILQVRDVPLFGYAMFYNLPLEIAPGATMDVYGPIHANRDIYVQSAAGLTFHGVVTTAGSIHHGRVPGLVGVSTDNGDVSFATTDGSTASMQQSSVWVDSSHSDWDNLSSSLWGGNVRTSTAGINPSTMANFPPYVPDDPTTPDNELVNDAHRIIEASTPTNASSYPGDDIESQKFASQASLVFVVAPSGTVKVYKYKNDSSGTYLRKTASGTATATRVELTVPADLIVGGVASNKFYDHRRAKWVSVLDIDVGELKTLIENNSAAAQWTKGSDTFSPATEWSGVIYVEHQGGSTAAVRLVNGGAVPSRPTSANGFAKGFTFATNAPAYILGNYNADGTIPDTAAQIRDYETDEHPAAVIADAVTILSKAWDDTASTSGLSDRKAESTEVSAALLTGIVPSNKAANSTYSGGVENFPRFLEDWGGRSFGYRGSIIALFESTVAIESWGSSNVYSPPQRVWGFSKLFEEGVNPPGTPSARTYRRVGFRQLSAQEYQAALLSP